MSPAKWGVHIVNIEVLTAYFAYFAFFLHIVHITLID